MQNRSQRCSRRRFLAQAAALTVTGGLASAAVAVTPVGSPPSASGPYPQRKPLAALCTVYRPFSEAYHLLGRFLHGYPRNGQLHVPAYFLHSLFLDQRPDNDLSKEVVHAGVRVMRNVAEALLGEGGGRGGPEASVPAELAVEGVLLVAEHGNYPRNDLGQVLYPRYEMFEQLVQVFRRTGKSVPVYLARHLSYKWERAVQMVEWARELDFPLLTGSSLPFAQRRPNLTLAPETPLEEVVVAGYGPIEANGFLGLEALQTLAEQRHGGEWGVRAVTCLNGNAVWQAGDAGRWSWNLLEKALSFSETANLGDIRRNVGRLAVGNMPAAPATAFLVEYQDGFRGTVLLLNGHVQDFSCAVRIRGQSEAIGCLFHLPGTPGARHFDHLASAIEEMLEKRKSPQTLERSLLLTGILEAALRSHRLRGQPVETPHLHLRYGVEC